MHWAKGHLGSYASDEVATSCHCALALTSLLIVQLLAFYSQRCFWGDGRPWLPGADPPICGEQLALLQYSRGPKLAIIKCCTCSKHVRQLNPWQQCLHLQLLTHDCVQDKPGMLQVQGPPEAGAGPGVPLLQARRL